MLKNYTFYSFEKIMEIEKAKTKFEGKRTPRRNLATGRHEIHEKLIFAGGYGRDRNMYDRCSSVIGKQRVKIQCTFLPACIYAV